LGLVGRGWGRGGFDGWSLEPLSNKSTSLLKVSLNLGLEMAERLRVTEMWNNVVAHGIYLLASTVDRPHNPNVFEVKP
jgi:hypothetical protein